MAFGGAVKLQGETEYRKALNQITNNLTVLSSEMKKVTSSFDKDNASITDLNNVNNTLNKKLEEQKKKVNEAAAMLEKAKKETDENSITTQKWQTALNNAQSEVNKTTQQIKNNKDVMEKMKQANVSNTQELKKFEQASKDASKQTSIFGDVLKANLASDVIMSGLSKMMDGIKKVSSALLNIGKQSLSSFGEYEQLVGGVETLFKDSSGVVQEYANNAYKTAGLSANEYMSTVTSFSASLLQSLNGDTAESAKVADMAITDMSDNANKMGTDMSMIQNAYQGFAKQNYTMLDNLKLGYGGTKTEMERLLSDAEKISGQKYDISNLNDVYQAIHVVQGELGITGTTAKEASSTIQGSLSSMKSAFQNLLTGLGNGDSDIGNLVNQLVDSAITAGNNVMPAIDRISQSIIDALPQILNAITQNLPNFLKQGAKILNSLIQGIQNNLPTIMTAVMQIINMLLNCLIQNLPQILQMGTQIIVSLVQGISEQSPTLIPLMISAILNMVDTILDNIDLIVDAGIQLVMGLADGLINALPDLVDKIPEIIDKLIVAITDNLPKLIEAGVELTIKLAEGLMKATPQLLSKIPQIISSIINGITNSFSQIKDVGGQILDKVKEGISNGISGMLDVGKNIVKGLWNGINDAKDWVLDKVKGFGKSVLDGIKSFFGIKSPSTLMRDMVGINLAKGIGVGFVDQMKSVTKDMQSAIPTNFDTGISVRELNAVKSSNYKPSNTNTAVDTNGGSEFNLTINNNSKYISPADNARQMKNNVQWYLLNKMRRA